MAVETEVSHNGIDSTPIDEVDLRVPKTIVGIRCEAIGRGGSGIVSLAF